MVEPFMSRRVSGRAANDLSIEAIIRSMTIAAALGATSAYTWLKVPEWAPTWSQLLRLRPFLWSCSAASAPTAQTRCSSAGSAR